VRLDFSAVDHVVPTPEPPALQRAALLNRIDLRRKLADYAVAEAALKLEVARQYPDITLVPGYFWDADESIWSIAGLALVPPRARTRALIREAELRREIEARAFLAVQSSVIAEAQAAAARYGRALAAHEAAVEVLRRARQRRREAASQFERGQADRVDVANAALEAVVAERTAIVAMLELQQGLSALEDAVQRPLDNPDLFAGVQPAAAPAEAALNPALIDND
jgi:outer membrane protein TolC